jgi:hypothetical protein
MDAQNDLAVSEFLAETWHQLTPSCLQLDASLLHSIDRLEESWIVQRW